jgi:uncharacterized protein YwlG (UPF0340 family)
MNTIKLAVLACSLVATSIVYAQQTPATKPAPQTSAQPATAAGGQSAPAPATTATTGTIAGVSATTVIAVGAAVIGVAAIANNNKSTTNH